MTDKKYIKTPEFRASFACVFEPKANPHSESDEKYYSVTMLFDKKAADLSEIKSTIDALKKATWTKLPKIKHPIIKDGDEEERDGYENCWYIRAKSKIRPKILNQLLKDITSEEEFYSGCYAKALLSFSTYDKGVNKGVSCWLHGLQKTKDGDPFVGSVDVEGFFEVIEMDTSTEAQINNYLQ